MHSNLQRLRWGGAAINPCAPGLLVSRAESAQEIDNEAYHQNQAKPAAANDGTAKVKPAAAEQEKKDDDD